MHPIYILQFMNFIFYDFKYKLSIFKLSNSTLPSKYNNKQIIFQFPWA